MNITKLKALRLRLKRLLAEYDRIEPLRKKLRVGNPFVYSTTPRWLVLQNRADRLSGDIMRTERKIVEEVLK